MTTRPSDDNHLSDAKRLLLEKRLRREVRQPNRKPYISVGRKPSHAPDLATAGQTQIWLQNQTDPESPANNITSSFVVNGELDIERLEKSLNRVVERHEILRSSYTMQPEGLTRIQDDHLRIKLSNTPVSDCRAAAALYVRTPFEIEKGPLLKMAVFTSSSEEILLVLVVHHIISDLQSIKEIWAEVSACYREAGGGPAPDLKALSIQYADYAFHQRKELEQGRIEDQRSYWLRHLKDPPKPIYLPTDFPYPPTIGYSGKIARGSISSILSEKVRLFASENDATLSMFLQFAFFVFLHRYSREDDILVATPVADRGLEETANLIGYFLNPLLIRLDFSKTDSIETAFSLLRKTFLTALNHQSFPVSEIAESLAFRRVAGRHPLAQTMFVFQNERVEAIIPDLEGCVCTPIFLETRTAKFDLTLFAFDTRPEIELMFEYRSDLFHEDTIKRALGHFNTILEAIIDDPQVPPGKIDFLRQDERDRRISAGIGQLAHEESAPRFLDQIRIHSSKTPASIALSDPNTRYSYGELESISDHIADTLQTLGAKENVVIGLFMERSPEAILAILGILKSGAAYLPIDPSYPTNRCDYLIEDAGTQLIICSTDSVEKIKSAASRLLLLEDLLKSRGDSRSKLGLSTDDSRLAYLIYTSGSTGNPKGVKISHRNLNASIQSRVVYYPAAPRRFLLTPSLSFDSSIAGIFWTLSTGGELIIPSEEQVRDPIELSTFIETQAISTWLCVPTLYTQVLEHLEPKRRTLETVIVAGEVCPASLVVGHFRTLAKTSLYNEYGPTEASVWATVHRCDISDVQLPSIPIGRPIPTATIRLLDPHGFDVPRGHEGELLIGGMGVSAGYVGKASESDEVFVELDGKHYYRTGDIAKWSHSGVLHFIGRSDHQVKLRGFRIETGEVEAALNTHPGIEQSVVIIGIDRDSLPDWESIERAVPEDALQTILAEFETDSPAPKSKADRSVIKNGFTIEFHQRDPDFMQTPRQAQRDWLINQALAEVSDDLDHLDKISPSFVSGYGKETDARINDVEKSRITKDEIMESWQNPIMKAMAAYTTESHGDILEIGFGHGVSAEYIQEQGVRSHTIIEMDDAIIQRYFEPWKKTHATKDIRIHRGRWQDTIEGLGTFDGIFFHTYPMSEEEFVEYILNSVTFAAHAFPVMAQHLKKGGSFSYFSAEIDSLSRRHQRKLLEHFSEVSFRIIDLEIPEKTKDAWWSKTIAVVKAVK